MRTEGKKWYRVVLGAGAFGVSCFAAAALKFRMRRAFETSAGLFPGSQRWRQMV